MSMTMELSVEASALQNQAFYRAIAAAVREGTLHPDGEAAELRTGDALKKYVRKTPMCREMQGRLERCNGL